MILGILDEVFYIFIGMQQKFISEIFGGISIGVDKFEQ